MAKEWYKMQALSPQLLALSSLKMTLVDLRIRCNTPSLWISWMTTLQHISCSLRIDVWSTACTWRGYFCQSLLHSEVAESNKAPSSCKKMWRFFFFFFFKWVHFVPLIWMSTGMLFCCWCDLHTYLFCDCLWSDLSCESSTLSTSVTTFFDYCPNVSVFYVEHIYDNYFWLLSKCVNVLCWKHLWQLFRLLPKCVSVLCWKHLWQLFMTVAKICHCSLLIMLLYKISE